MEKLTDLKVKNAKKPDSGEYYIREGKGFVLRVRPTGSKSFYYMFDLKGKRCRMLLGQYPAVSLADARNKHLEAQIMVNRGEDPRIPKIEESVSEPEIVTVELLADKWAEWSKKHHNSKWSNTLLLALKKDVIPQYGQRLAAEIRRKDAIEILETKAATAPGQANNLHKALRGMWQYGVERELVDFNPFADIRAAKSIPAMKQVSRKRILSDDEIKLIWHAIDQGGGSESTKRALKVMLLTGQRSGEVCGMQSTEIQIGIGKPLCQMCRGCGWWNIPEERRQGNKGGEHRVYLSRLALKIIGDGQGYIFQGDLDNKPISSNSVNHHVRRNVEATNKLPYYGLPRWTPHDLRRTCGTGIRRLGCSRDTMNIILGHEVGGVTKVYDRYEGDPEKEQWLLAWSEYLEPLIFSSENVQ